MATLHARDENGVPIGRDEVDDPADIHAIIIDEPFRRIIVDVGTPGRLVSCRECEAGDCSHATQARELIDDWTGEGS